MSSRDLITFPAGVLSADPVRLPVLARGDGWIAVDKPVGVGGGPDLVEPGVRDIETALVRALAARKPQLAELGLTHAGRIHHLDADVSGVLVLATSTEAEARLRNDLGSKRWEFVFDLLSETGRVGGEKTVTCNLPLTRHGTEPRIIVSRSGGRKCETTFSPVRSYGRWALWEACARENRPHQIRIHAAECDLRIPGENTYEHVGRVFLSQLKRKYRPGRGEERPLHAALCLHLREVRFANEAGVTNAITAPRPKSFGVLLRRLGEDAGDERQLLI